MKGWLLSPRFFATGLEQPFVSACLLICLFVYSFILVEDRGVDNRHSLNPCAVIAEQRRQPQRICHSARPPGRAMPTYLGRLDSACSVRLCLSGVDCVLACWQPGVHPPVPDGWIWDTRRMMCTRRVRRAHGRRLGNHTF